MAEITLIIAGQRGISNIILSSSGSGITTVSGTSQNAMLAQGEAGITVIQTPAPVIPASSANPAFDEAFQ